MADEPRLEITERYVLQKDSGWAVAVLILLAVMLFGFLFAWRSYHAALSAAQQNTTTSLVPAVTPLAPNTGVPSGDSTVSGNASGAGTSAGMPTTSPSPREPQ